MYRPAAHQMATLVRMDKAGAWTLCVELAAHISPAGSRMGRNRPQRAAATAKAKDAEEHKGQAHPTGAFRRRSGPT